MTSSPARTLLSSPTVASSPDTVLSRYACNGTIAATVFGADGEVLHEGREHRYATPAQIRGLIARDKGCVLCRADVSECEAHHLVPWNAPAQGDTDIENLALSLIHISEPTRPY